ncbi:MAG: hypothetical protein SVY41_03470 [Candidatus Nanohaloarchaea archaeon]|nr:hypothetical protein [Candidatus Nanohaloarchaea archaeon]
MTIEPRRVAVHAALIALTAVSVTATIVWSYRTGSLLYTALGSLAAWTAFITAHRFETGRFVDPPGGDHTVPSYPLLGLGLLMMIVAFPVAIFGVHTDLPVVILAGELLFFTGWVVSHDGLTGSLY